MRSGRQSARHSTGGSTGASDACPRFQPFLCVTTSRAACGPECLPSRRLWLCPSARGEPRRRAAGRASASAPGSRGEYVTRHIPPFFGGALSKPWCKDTCMLVHRPLLPREELPLLQSGASHLRLKPLHRRPIPTFRFLPSALHLRLLPRRLLPQTPRRPSPPRERRASLPMLLGRERPRHHQSAAIAPPLQPSRHILCPLLVRDCAEHV